MMYSMGARVEKVLMVYSKWKLSGKRQTLLTMCSIEARVEKGQCLIVCSKGAREEKS